ncbi:MAG: hypothetical protein AAF675_04000 [Pseudomonadota bacterium]
MRLACVALAVASWVFLGAMVGTDFMGPAFVAEATLKIPMMGSVTLYGLAAGMMSLGVEAIAFLVIAILTAIGLSVHDMIRARAADQAVFEGPAPAERSPARSAGRPAVRTARA